MRVYEPIKDPRLLSVRECLAQQTVACGAWAVGAKESSVDVRLGLEAGL